MEINDIIMFIDSMRERGAVEIKVGEINVTFNREKPMTTPVEVSPQAQKIENGYDEEDLYWSAGSNA